MILIRRKFLARKFSHSDDLKGKFLLIVCTLLDFVLGTEHRT